MRLFQFRPGVDELDSRSSITQSKKAKNDDHTTDIPQRHVTNSYIQDVMEKIGLAQQTIEKVCQLNAINQQKSNVPPANGAISSSYSRLEDVVHSKTERQQKKAGTRSLSANMEESISKMLD
jgi:hypothetical protein